MRPARVPRWSVILWFPIGNFPREQAVSVPSGAIVLFLSGGFFVFAPVRELVSELILGGPLKMAHFSSGLTASASSSIDR